MKTTSKLIFLTSCFFSFFTVTAQELHTHANAASINNESDSFAGWGGSATESSVSTEAYSGNFSIKLESPNNGWNYAAYTFPTTPDEEYLVTLYAKSNSTEDPRIQWGGVVENTAVLITETNWAQYSKTVVATGSSIHVNVYPGTPAVTGSTIYIDHVSITPVSGGSDTQAPTAPTLTSTGQTDTTAGLSWSGATDNTAVTGYKVFKDGVLETTLGNVSTYQVTGLSASTPYSFTVTALDAAANESVASNSVSVTTASGGGPSGGSPVWTEANSVASYNGSVGIGVVTVPTGYKMAVDGKLITEEVKVQLTGNWPDYVFQKGYDLPTLEDVEKHIKEKGHLINIPSAREVEANGIELGEMDKLLLEKIEELTLYIISLEKEINNLKCSHTNH